MSTHDEFMADPAFQRAVKAAASARTLIASHHNDDPEAADRLVAMAVLVGFANAGGLSEPHVGILARFAPDLGFAAESAVAGAR